MKFAISLGMLNPRVWPDVTQEADRLGYDSVWLPEHLVFPVQTEGSPFHGADHPPVPADVPVFDAFTYLGFLAGRTERIRFSTHVYNIGLRHPFVPARA
ncbi:MAG TPA: LLM class flavin-dependent oxidoreductase, partial [Acidimicrobiales bacterium]|nr:LLM class flavin-dependent oxidoreductase [Acidimicrobiales bacterium]